MPWYRYRVESQSHQTAHRRWQPKRQFAANELDQFQRNRVAFQNFGLRSRVQNALVREYVHTNVQNQNFRVRLFGH